MKNTTERNKMIEFGYLPVDHKFMFNGDLFVKRKKNVSFNYRTNSEWIAFEDHMMVLITENEKKDLVENIMFQER